MTANSHGSLLFSNSSLWEPKLKWYIPSQGKSEEGTVFKSDTKQNAQLLFIKICPVCLLGYGSHSEIPAYFSSMTPFAVKPTDRDTAQVRVAVRPTPASSRVFSPWIRGKDQEDQCALPAGRREGYIQKLFFFSIKELFCLFVFPLPERPSSKDS